MKKVFVLLLLFVAATVVPAHAEMIWKSGYVILASGDSVKGEIKVNTKKELTLFQKVAFKHGETMKTYKPEQVKEYGFEEKKFVSRKVEGEGMFLKVLSSGKVNLYEGQFEFYRGDQLIVESEYYIEKSGDSELHKAKPGKFKKTVADLMADNTELVTRVQGEDKKYEVGDMVSIVNEYNEWYEQQTGLQGSR